MSAVCRYLCGCDQFPEDHCSCMQGHRTGATYDHDSRQWLDVDGNPVAAEPATDLYWPEDDE